jgi:hypothetical protein
MEHVGLKVKNRVFAEMTSDEEMKRLQMEKPEEFSILFESKVSEQIAMETQSLAQMERQFYAQANQDPLVQLKQQEIDLRAMDLQRKMQEQQEKMEFDATKFGAKQTLDEDKQTLNEEIQRKRLELQEEQIKQRGN